MNLIKNASKTGTIFVFLLIASMSLLSGCNSKAQASETFSKVQDENQGVVSSAPIENVDRAEYNDGIVAHCLNGVGYYSTFAGFLTPALNQDGSLMLCEVTN